MLKLRFELSSPSFCRILQSESLVAESRIGLHRCTRASALIGNSDHSPCGSKAKLFHIQFSDLHVSKEDSIQPRCGEFKSQLFEAEYLADEESIFVPADVAAIVHPSQQETFRVRELWQLAWQSKRAGVVKTRWDLVVRPSCGRSLLNT